MFSEPRGQRAGAPNISNGLVLLRHPWQGGRWTSQNLTPVNRAIFPGWGCQKFGQHSSPHYFSQTVDNQFHQLNDHWVYIQWPETLSHDLSRWTCYVRALTHLCINLAVLPGLCLGLANIGAAAIWLFDWPVALTSERCRASWFKTKKARCISSGSPCHFMTFPHHILDDQCRHTRQMSIYWYLHASQYQQYIYFFRFP